MPMVNGKEYAYTAKGMKAAKMEAKKSGKKMVNSPARSPEAGQFWGAVLQNRKYNSKGQQMKK